MKARIITALILASHIANTASAASIESAEISDTHDTSNYYTVTIKGTGFGSGPNIVMFDDFNNQEPNVDVALDKALIGTWTKTSSYSSVPKTVTYNGSGAVSIHDFSKTTTAKIRQFEVSLPEKINDIFLSYSVVVPEGRFFSGSSTDYTFPDVSSWKFTWITDTASGIASSTLFNICTPTHSGSGSFMLAGNSTNYGWYEVKKSWSWHSKNYISFGMQPDNTSPITNPGMLIFSLTGKKDAALLVNRSDIQLFKEDNSTGFDIIKFPGWFGNGDTSNFDAYYDDIYVAIGDNSFSRIEISNTEKPIDSVINLTMPATEWSDNTITFKLHKENMKIMDKIFLRIYDNKNNFISYALACPLCPKPPLTH